MSCDVGKATSPTSQLILQPFRRFTYVTTHSPTLPLLHLRHSSFSNHSFTSPTSQALHLRHLTNRPCIPTLVTKFSQNIVADTDKNKAPIDCLKCSFSFLSIVKSHPLKIPASVLEKVRSGSCLKLFLIDCNLKARNESSAYGSVVTSESTTVSAVRSLSLDGSPGSIQCA